MQSAVQLIAPSVIEETLDNDGQVLNARDNIHKLLHNSLIRNQKTARTADRSPRAFEEETFLAKER